MRSPPWSGVGGVHAACQPEASPGSTRWPRKLTCGPSGIEAIARHGAANLMAIGGAAYLVSKAIRASRVVAFEDLGMEAIYEFEVEDMPVTVAVDSRGTSVHRTGAHRAPLLHEPRVPSPRRERRPPNVAAIPRPPVAGCLPHVPALRRDFSGVREVGRNQSLLVVGIPSCACARGRRIHAADAFAARGRARLHRGSCANRCQLRERVFAQPYLRDSMNVARNGFSRNNICAKPHKLRAEDLRATYS